jgi:hypothetical protein
MSTKRILAAIISLAFLSPIAATAHSPDYHTEGDIQAAERGTFSYGDDGTPASHLQGVPPATPQTTPVPSLSTPEPGSR